jgi:hypothetical protein
MAKALLAFWAASLVASEARASETYNIVSTGVSDRVTLASYGRDFASCSAMAGDKEFVLDLSTAQLWLLDQATNERSALSEATVRQWKSDSAQFEKTQAEARRKLLEDPDTPSELRDILATTEKLTTAPNFSPKWTSAPLPNSRVVPGLVLLNERLVEIDRLVREIHGSATANISQFRCFADSHRVPYDLVVDGGRKVRFEPVLTSTDEVKETEAFGSTRLSTMMGLVTETHTAEKEGE